MVDKVVYEQVHIRCRLKLLKIHKCDIYAKYGEYTKAEIAAYVREEDAIHFLVNRLEEKLEILIGSTNNDIEELLFAGVIKNIDLIKNGSDTVIFLYAVSDTWEVGKGEHCRGNVDLSRYTYSIISCNRNKMKQDGYQIEDLGCLKVGDSLKIQNMAFYVRESYTTFEEDVLKCSCEVFPKQ